MSYCNTTPGFKIFFCWEGIQVDIFLKLLREKKPKEQAPNDAPEELDGSHMHKH